MRGLEIMILMVCIVLGFGLVPVLLPTYNNGGGIDTGANDLSNANAFNWSTVSSYELKENPTIVDQASYYLNLAIMAITGVGTLLFTSAKLAPSLLNIFMVNPVLMGVLLSILAISIILAWLQIIKGDDWSGRR